MADIKLFLDKQTIAIQTAIDSQNSKIEELRVAQEGFLRRLEALEAAAASPHVEESPAKRRATTLDSGRRRCDEACASSPGPCVLWVSGFPRKLLKHVLEKEADGLIALLPEALRRKAKPTVRGLSFGFCVDFGSFDDARTVLHYWRDSDDALLWTDRVNDQKVELRVKFDKTIDERVADKALGSIWKAVQAELQELGKWDAGMKLIRSGKPGALFLVAEDEAWELVGLSGALTPQCTVADLSVHEANIAKFGIARAKMDAWVDEAVAAVRLRRR